MSARIGARVKVLLYATENDFKARHPGPTVWATVVSDAPAPGSSWARTEGTGARWLLCRPIPKDPTQALYARLDETPGK